MRFGVIGTGVLGSEIARGLVKAGHELMADAAKAEVVFLAMPENQAMTALAELPPWRGRIVVDAMNPVAALPGQTSSELVASLLPGARLVKAFSTLPPPFLWADPLVGEGHRVLFLSGDDDGARETVARLIETSGFATMNLGTLIKRGKLQSYAASKFDVVRFSKSS